MLSTRFESFVQTRNLTTDACCCGSLGLRLCSVTLQVQEGHVSGMKFSEVLSFLCVPFLQEVCSCFNMSFS